MGQISFLIVIFIIDLFYKFVKYIKYRKIKINNEILNDENIFKYRKLVNEAKKYNKYRVIMFVGTFILVFGFILSCYMYVKIDKTLFIVLAFILLLVLIFFSRYIPKKYRLYYKEEIIRAFVINYDTNLTYSAIDNSLKDEFCKWYSYREKFEGTDFITDKIENLNYYIINVYAYNIHNDAGFGDRRNTNIKVNQVKCLFGSMILPKNFINVMRFKSSEKVDLYQDAYNYQFNIQELIRKINDLEQETGISFEIQICENNLVFKFFVENFFEPTFFLNGENNFITSLSILENIKIIIKEVISVLIRY